MTKFSKGEIPEPTFTEGRKRAGTNVGPMPNLNTNPLAKFKEGHVAGNPLSKFVPVNPAVKRPSPPSEVVPLKRNSEGRNSIGTT